MENLIGKVNETTVLGRKYKYWADFTMKSMYAKNEDGEVKRIYGSGYVSNDLTVRKFISYAFQTGSFRK